MIDWFPLGASTAALLEVIPTRRRPGTTPIRLDTIAGRHHRGSTPARRRRHRDHGAGENRGRSHLVPTTRWLIDIRGRNLRSTSGIQIPVDLRDRSIAPRPGVP